MSIMGGSAVFPELTKASPPSEYGPLRMKSRKVRPAAAISKPETAHEK